MLMGTENFYDRLLPLFGGEALDKLARSRVILFGVGGVGGTCAEALVRGGVGSLTLVDGDVFAPSNLNRQRFAPYRAVGGDNGVPRILFGKVGYRSFGV